MQEATSRSAERAIQARALGQSLWYDNISRQLLDSGVLQRLIDDGIITLTRAGRSLATTVVRRHRLAERFLTDIMGLSWADAHHEAGKWEHVVSPVVEEAMMRILDDPTTCPHGNPIPGSDYERPAGSHALSDVDPGGSFIVHRIPEELEFQDGQLEFLEVSGVLPDRTGTVLSRSPEGTTTIEMAEGTVGISAFASKRILVTDG